MNKYDEVIDMLLLMFDDQCDKEDFIEYFLPVCEDIHNEFLSLEENCVESINLKHNNQNYLYRRYNGRNKTSNTYS